MIKIKVRDLRNELEANQRVCRNFNTEVFRLRAGWEEVNKQLDAVKRENKNLAEEIKDLLDPLELLEKLQAALEEAEAILDHFILNCSLQTTRFSVIFLKEQSQS